MKYIYPGALLAACAIVAGAVFSGFALSGFGDGLVLDLHLAFIWGTLAVVVYSDEQALLWILGKKRVMNKRLLEWLHALVGVGLAGLLTTGGLLFFVGGYDFLLSDPAFIIKMVFVAALLINGFFISYVNKLATLRSWGELSDAQRMPLLLSGAVSVCGWAGAVICGLLLH
jgi:hypothetical protein